MSLVSREEAVQQSATLKEKKMSSCLEFLARRISESTSCEVKIAKSRIGAFTKDIEDVINALVEKGYRVEEVQEYRNFEYSEYYETMYIIKWNEGVVAEFVRSSKTKEELTEEQKEKMAKRMLIIISLVVVACLVGWFS